MESKEFFEDLLDDAVEALELLRELGPNPEEVRRALAAWQAAARADWRPEVLVLLEITEKPSEISELAAACRGFTPGECMKAMAFDPEAWAAGFREAIGRAAKMAEALMSSSEDDRAEREADLLQASHTALQFLLEFDRQELVMAAVARLYPHLTRPTRRRKAAIDAFITLECNGAFIPFTGWPPYARAVIRTAKFKSVESLDKFRILA